MCVVGAAALRSRAAAIHIVRRRGPRRPQRPGPRQERTIRARPLERELLHRRRRQTSENRPVHWRGQSGDSWSRKMSRLIERLFWFLAALAFAIYGLAAGETWLYQSYYKWEFAPS